MAGLGDLPADEFRAVVRTAAWEIAAGVTIGLTGLLREFNEEPVWWADDVRRQIRLFRDNSAGPNFGVPTDFRDAAGPNEALDRFRSFVGGYGHLLTHWHELVAGAVDLRARGIMPAEPL